MQNIAIAKAELFGTAADDSSLIFGAIILNVAKRLGFEDRVFLSFYIDEDDKSFILATTPQANSLGDNEVTKLLDIANGIYPMLAVSPEYRLTTKH